MMSADPNVDVRVVGVVVRHGDPIQVSGEVEAHAVHEVPGEAGEVEVGAVFGGEDDLEEALVAGALPLSEALGDIGDVAVGVEAGHFFSGAFAGDVTAVGGPLASYAIGRVGDSHGAALVVGFDLDGAAGGAAAVAGGLRGHARKVHDALEGF